MLEGELNDLFENNMDLWNKFFGLMDKQPDMDTPYADYLTEQLTFPAVRAGRSAWRGCRSARPRRRR